LIGYNSYGPSYHFGSSSTPVFQAAGRAMGFIEILWTVAGILVPLLLGTAWAMIGLSPPEFAIARGCVAVAAIVFIGVSFIWIVLLQWPTGLRLVVAAAVGALSIIVFSESFRFINDRESAFVSKLATDAEQRKKTVAQLQEFYVEVGPIITRSLPKEISEADFKKYSDDADTWLTKVATWIQENMGVAARERFLDRTGMLAASWSGAVNERHNSIIQNLTQFRKNLLVLIESGAWDKR
jgi:hypothetical protein